MQTPALIIRLLQLKSLELNNFTGILPSFDFNSNSLKFLILSESSTNNNDYNNDNQIFYHTHYLLNLPISLISLNLSGINRFPLSNELISFSYLINLKELFLHENFNFPLNENFFPSSLEFLHFWILFNQPIHPGVLPSSLKELKFDYNSEFDQPIEPGWIPE